MTEYVEREYLDVEGRPAWADVAEYTEEPLDYDEQLEKYGWRMEVPGDPFNLKYVYM